jgi:hypothetical protein
MGTSLDTTGFQNRDMLEEGAPNPPPAYGDVVQPGEFLTGDPIEISKAILKLWSDQDVLHRTRREAWKVAKLRREGVTGARLVKKQDLDQWQAWVPPGQTMNVPGINKADALCDKLVANLLVDPPRPDPIPTDGGDEDRDDTELAERILNDVLGENGVSYDAMVRAALDRGTVYDSGFIWHYIDPQGGGRQPVRMLAHPDAVDAQTPFQGPSQMGLAGSMPGPQLPPPYSLRHVTPDGQLQDTPDGAALTWAPKLKCEVVTGRHLRFLPPDANDIWEAHGVLRAGFMTVGKMKLAFPETAAYTEEQWGRVCAYKPEKARDLLPDSRRRDDEGEKDSRLAFYVICCYTECPDYPDGFYGVAVDGAIPYRQPWTDTTDGKRQPLDLPVTQFKGPERGADDPYGVGLMRVVGDANELRVAQVGTLLQYLDRLNTQKTFVPVSSIVNPKDLTNSSRRIIPMNPGGQPVNEELPDYPQASMAMFDLVSTEMDSASGLQQAAQGVEDPSVTSGRQAQQIVAQVLAGLSSYKSMIERGYVRGCRIVLQLVRMAYTRPQMLRFTGEDGAYRSRSWTGADLQNVANIQLKAGSLSMMNAAMKADASIQLQQTGLLTVDELRDILESHVGSTIGLQDNPIRLRARRQIARWKDGPPPGWAPAPPTVIQGVQGAQIQPPAPVVFVPVPADELPGHASIRLVELARTMMSVAYEQADPNWRQEFDQEFERMRQAAGIQTVGEQQAAQQAAALQAQAAAAAQPVGLDSGTQQAGTAQQAGLQQAQQQTQAALRR